MSDGKSFRLSDYLENGRHGVLQEISITNQLGSFFNPGDNFFPSPKYADGLEFTDYILIDGNAAIIIESKFIISDKQTKKHQSLRKAVRQLNKAENLILDGKTELLEPSIQRVLQKMKVVMKVCLINDRIELTDQNTQALSSEFNKAELPLFISLSAFIQLLVALKLKNKEFLSYNLFYNFIQMFNAYFTSDDDKILYKNSFSVEGLSIDELNRIGKASN
jgi:hypothetical protein